VKKLSEKFSINANFISTIFKKIKLLDTKLNYTHQTISIINLFFKYKQLQKILKCLTNLDYFN
jgi:hypothetical protein